MKGGRLLDAQLGPQLLAELAELAAEKAALELLGDATAQLCIDYLSMSSVPREAFFCSLHPPFLRAGEKTIVLANFCFSCAEARRDAVEDASSREQ